MTFELRPLVLLITTLLEYIEYNGHQNITKINFFVVTNDKYNMNHIYLIVDVSIIYFSFCSSPVEVRLFAYFFRRLSPNFSLTVSDNKGALASLFLYWIHSILAVMHPSVVIATYIILLIIILVFIDFLIARYNISLPNWLLY